MVSQTPTLNLDTPSAEMLDDAYRSLPRAGRVLASCAPSSLASTLRLMEAVGFVAMRVSTGLVDGPPYLVIGYKAKHGPCYDTGKTARYNGTALAALDDDNHLLFGELPVCEKTAVVYTLAPYSGLVEVSQGDQDLMARLDQNPVLFDCNTFERDLERLLAQLPAEGDEHGGEVPVLYPGPFRLLVLSDGAMLRRAQATLVARERVDPLVSREGCVTIDTHAIDPLPALSLVEEHRSRGSAALLGDLPLVDTIRSKTECDLDALDTLSFAMRRRIQTLIEQGHQHFILTGSSPEDRYGCCPSTDVGEALQLVDAGILGAYRAPAPPDSCPTTVFAIAGEIAIEAGEPRFRIDPDRRGKVLERL